jgi:quercetin dioxygenase-like cupin family protein
MHAISNSKKYAARCLPDTWQAFFGVWLRRTFFLVVAAIFAGACSVEDANDESVTAAADARGNLPPGSNQRLRAPVTIAEGLEVIISDVVIPAGATVPRHYHPGEEFVYVIDGSAVHVEQGKPEQILRAGDAYVIPPRAIHEPRGGPEGARAIVFRLHVEGQDERILVPE